MEEWHGIQIDPSDEEGLTEIARDLLAGFYKDSSVSNLVAFARPALAYSDSPEMAQEIYDDVAKRQWAMYSSPILSNAPEQGQKTKSQPISCFLSMVPDTKEGLVSHQQELADLSMAGGGVGGHWRLVRSASEKSVGVMPHNKVADSAVEAFRQGKTRKGSYAAYLDVSHPDILEFLAMRTPTGGDINRKCFNIHHAINLTDEFMRSVISGAEWDLICPHTKRVTDTVDARELFEWIIDTRFRTGEPYLNWIDTANRYLPEALKALGLEIHGSNLCNEIHLPTSPDRTAVCCLSSVNLEKYDEWKHDPDFIYRWVRFLDNVLTSFIENAPDSMSRAKFSAMRERSIGLGAMGFHAYLQSKLIPWESFEARMHNKAMFKHIKTMADKATFELADERGEAPDMQGTGRRNAHLLAIAPNANSGLLIGTSPSIELLRSNGYSQMTRAGTHLAVNDKLVKHIRDHAPREMLSFLSTTVDEWVDKQIQEVILNDGSCQNLGYLPQEIRDVFKTAFETDPRWTIIHAADRQPFLCQGQSVNLYYPFGSDKSKVMADHIYAWAAGLKGLYYLRTESGFSGDKVSSQMERKALKDAEPKPNDEEVCEACQG